MEDISKYIESGILELYVMGDLGPAERSEVEVFAQKYPEIRKEINEIERALQAYAEAHAVSPDPALRNKVLNSVHSEKLRPEASTYTPEPSTTTRQINTPILTPTSSFYRYAFAASVALLLISWTALFMVYNQLETTEQSLASLESANQQFSNKVNYMNQELDKRDEALRVLGDPDFQRVRLGATPNAPASAELVVAFNPQKEEVLIDLSSIEMPANDSEHQYQLWALIDGKPVDLGVFDIKDDQAAGFIKMKSSKTPQAFAVTLEKRGGSAVPTMDFLMLIGNV